MPSAPARWIMAPVPTPPGSVPPTPDAASPRRAVLPERPRLRGISHLAAAAVFPALGVALVVAARTPAGRIAAGIYTVGLTAMYATSAAYHRGRWTPTERQRLRRLDHSMILVGIAATYTPVAAVALPRRSGHILLAVVWGLAAVGIIIRNLWLGAPRWVVAAVYIVVGWVAVGVLPTLWHRLGGVSFALLLLGGALYSVGAVVYSRRRPDPWPGVFGYHEVFHALVVFAGVAFYVMVLRVLVAAPARA